MPALHRRLNTSQKGNCVATSNSEQTVSMLGHIYACRLFFFGVLSMADENEVKQVQEPTQEQQQQQSTEQQPTEPPPPEPQAAETQAPEAVEAPSENPTPEIAEAPSENPTPQVAEAPSENPSP